MTKSSFKSVFHRIIKPALVFLFFVWILPLMISVIINLLRLSFYKGYQGWLLTNIFLYVVPIIFLSFFLKKNTDHAILESPRFVSITISLLFVALNLLLTMVLHKFLPTPVASNQTDVLSTLSNSSILGVQLELLTITFLGPIFEELMCRGVLMNFYFKKSKYGFDVILSAIIFSIFHQHQNLIVLLPYFIVGLLLGILYRLTGKVQYTMLVHILINTIIAWPYIQDNVIIFL